MKHEEQTAMFARRGDRYSELMSRLLRDRWRGEHLVTEGGLTPEEYEELMSLVPEAHVKARDELTLAMGSLRSQLATWDPLYITAMVQLRTTWGDWGTYYEPTQPFGEHFVELTGGLLCTRMDASEILPPTGERLSALFDELDHIMETLLVLNLTRPTGDDLDHASLRFLGAMRWLMMRGDSYATHGVDLARALCAPHAGWMLETYGFVFDDVIRVVDTVTNLVQDRVNALFPESLRRGTELVNEYVKAHRSSGKPSREELTALQAEAAMSFFSHAIRDAMTVTAAEIAESDSSVTDSQATAVLRELSVSTGSLDPSVYTGLFDVNPLRERPFLEADGRYLLVSPGMIVRDTAGVFEGRLIGGQPGYPSSRARTLDNLAVQYLSSMLPGAHAHVHLFYEVPDRVELDGLLLLDDLAIVVEGKASSVSVQGLRGDTTRLARDIQDAVEEAWVQGSRARKYILGPGDSVFEDEDGREVLRIPEGAVSEVHIINPTLHELGGHAPQLPRLRALGLFPADEYPWSVYVNDLRVISETCENAAVFVHYLVWRGRLPLGDRVTVADELDLWGSYLLAERFGMLAEPDGVLGIGNYTTDLDAYYDGVMGRGPERSKPRKFLEGPVRRFVERMATEQPPGWRAAAGVCLDLSIPEIPMVCHETNELAREASRSGNIVGKQVGRVALIGVPIGGDRPTIDELRGELDDPTLVIYASIKSKSRGGRPGITWAEYAKQVTFELSEYEVLMQGMIHGSDSPV